VYIEGKITTRSYDDKDGNKRYITEVVGREMTLVGGRPDGGGGSSEHQSSGSAQPVPAPAEPTDLDDLPF
jgi:single-strand DNA-binding protein